MAPASKERLFLQIRCLVLRVRVVEGLVQDLIARVLRRGTKLQHFRQDAYIILCLLLLSLITLLGVSRQAKEMYHS